MHPLLLKIGPIPLHTYGFLIAAGFITAIYLIRRLAVKNGLNVERTIDLTFWCLVSGFVGARGLFILTNISQFTQEPLSIFKIWEGGLVFFGGVLTALPFGIWYVRKFRLPLWKTMDILLPGLVVGHFFGRLGCFGAGCCYGKPTDLPWGIRLYSQLVDSDLRGIPLHPTQLYEAFSLFVLLLGLLLIFKKKKFDGQVALTYFIVYPVIRSLIEIFRGDLIRGFVIPDVLSTSQFISALIFIVAIIALCYRLKQVSHS